MGLMFINKYKCLIGNVIIKPCYLLDNIIALRRPEGRAKLQIVWCLCAVYCIFKCMDKMTYFVYKIMGVKRRDLMLNRIFIYSTHSLQIESITYKCGWMTP